MVSDHDIRPAHRDEVFVDERELRPADKPQVVGEPQIRKVRFRNGEQVQGKASFDDRPSEVIQGTR